MNKKKKNLFRDFLPSVTLFLNLVQASAFKQPSKQFNVLVTMYWECWLSKIELVSLTKQQKHQQMIDEHYQNMTRLRVEDLTFSSAYQSQSSFIIDYVEVLFSKLLHNTAKHFFSLLLFFLAWLLKPKKIARRNSLEELTTHLKVFDYSVLEIFYSPKEQHKKKTQLNTFLSTSTSCFVFLRSGHETNSRE